MTHKGTASLQTERLSLRQFKLSDAEDMYSNWVTDPQVSRFWSWEPHTNISETKALLTTWIADYAKPDNYHWVIELNDISQAIGYIYLSDIDDVNNSVSVHYALSRKYWGKGLITEACKRVFDFAFNELGVKKIHTQHHIENPASGRVLLKSGMKYIKTEYKQFSYCERISADYCFYEIENL